MPIRIFKQTPGRTIARTRLLNTAGRICRGEDIAPGRMTHVIICDEPTIRSLNATYRKKDRVTDVLSFSFNDPDLLGEIYICLPRAAEQAKQYGHSLPDELVRLLVHGMIHLLGHDHHTPAERRRMESVERKYLPAFRPAG